MLAPDPTGRLKLLALGFDAREAIGYHVFTASVLRHASAPVAITALASRGMPMGSNEFTYSRFLVPWLHGTGHAIYMDGDMLVRGDIAELWNLRRHDLGVQVVKHEYRTTTPTKYLGAPNEDYPCKNWSSVILWNCGFMKNRRLTPQFVAKQTGAFLHRFQWLDPDRVGTLPREWNHLVGEYPPDGESKLLHFTLGTPCFGGEYAQQEGAGEWFRTWQNASAPLGGPATTG